MAKIQGSLLKNSQLWPPPMLVSFTVDPDWDSESPDFDRLERDFPLTDAIRSL